MVLRASLAALAVAALALPVHAGVLYKSVSQDGAITFSDMPPPAGAKLLEQRVIKADGVVSSAAADVSRAMDVVGNLFDSDAAIAQANQAVDMAEHALALARRELWSVRDGLRLKSTAKTAADEERVAFYQRNVLAARKYLIELVQERRVAEMQPGAPRIDIARARP